MAYKRISPIPVVEGGTGAQTLTGVLTGNGTSAVTANAVTEGAVLLGGSSNAVSDTGVLAKGTVLVGDGSGSPTLLTVGANDTILTADSAESSGAKWAASSGGGSGWVYLDSATASSSSTLDFTTSIDSTYFAYAFIMNNVIPSTDGVYLYLRTSANGGSTWDSGTNNYYTGMLQSYNGVGVADVYIILTASTQGNNTSNFEYLNGILYMYDPASTSEYTTFTSNTAYSSGAGTPYTNLIFGKRNATSLVDGVRFFYSSGNIASGTIKLYGIAKPS